MGGGREKDRKSLLSFSVRFLSRARVRARRIIFYFCPFRNSSDASIVRARGDSEKERQASSRAPERRPVAGARFIN